MAEFDARPGRVRDAVASSQRDWQDFLELCVRQAQEQGEIDAAADVVQLAFELDAVCRAGSAQARLHDDPSFYDRAARAMDARLDAVTATPGPERPVRSDS